LQVTTVEHLANRRIDGNLAGQLISLEIGLEQSDQC
jgi:hypothetical protein